MSTPASGSPLKRTVRGILGLAGLLIKREPYLFSALLVCYVYLGCQPVLILSVGRSLVDSVVAVGRADGTVGRVMMWMTAEFSLLALGEILQRVRYTTERVLGDRVSAAMGNELIVAATEVSLEEIERPSVQDTLLRAAEAANGPIRPVSMALAVAQGLITFFSLAVGVLSVGQVFVLLLLVPLAPWVASEMEHVRQVYWLMFGTAEQRRGMSFWQNLATHLPSAFEIRLNRMGPYIGRTYRNLVDDLNRQTASLLTRHAGRTVLFGLLGLAFHFVAYWVIVQRTLAGDISLGSMLFLAGSFFQTRAAATQILLNAADLFRLTLPIDDYFSFVGRVEEGVADSTMTPLTSLVGDREGLHLTLNSVGYRYEVNGRWALRNVDGTIAPGSRVALVGPNGSGKSTLIRVLSGLVEPARGEVLAVTTDGRLASVRDAVFVVPQHPLRLSASVAENVLLSDEVMDRHNDIERALRLVALEDVVARVGGQTARLGREFATGEELSGGEWQRLALTRALLSPAPVWVFDEPVAFLDPQSRSHCLSAIAAFEPRRTIVMATHEEELAQWADEVWFLRYGRIVARGSHRHLWRSSLEYRGYWRETRPQAVGLG